MDSVTNEKIKSGDIVLKLISENLTEKRHTETHRKDITNFIVIFGGVGATIAGSLRYNRIEIIPIAIFLIILGLFGALVTKKLYERQLWYDKRLTILYKELDKIQGNLGIYNIYKEHENAHKKKYIILSKIRMHLLWMLLNLLVTTIGIVLIVVSK